MPSLFCKSLLREFRGASKVAEIFQTLFDHLLFGLIQKAGIGLGDLLQYKRQQGFDVVKAAFKLPFRFRAKILR